MGFINFDPIIMNTDLPIEKIKKCMGDPEADVENEVLKSEQQHQVTFIIYTYFQNSYNYKLS